MGNLISFDWAVKKLLRNKANFDILEGFLSELLEEDIVVQQILESESNKQSENDKFNRVDILVRTRQNELMLVEVQNDPEVDYFQRILYGTSKLVTEYLKEGEGYGSIQKIISINILYFRLSTGRDYVYEYKGSFVGKHTREVLKSNSWQKNKFKIQTISDIFPKYYLLRINNFNNVARNTLDEWIYFLKNNELPENYTAKGLKAVAEKLRVEQLSEVDKKSYQRFLESRWIEKSVTETAILESKKVIVQNAIKAGLSPELITTITQLTYEQVQMIRAEWYSRPTDEE
jgi:predicted transposase/invertase (TIGR01784 family)